MVERVPSESRVRIEYTRGYQRPDGILHIASIGVSVPLSAIYQRIEFSAE
jgi:hypothetical protein